MRLMKKGEVGYALAFVAAVVGAGFASGREIVCFFSAFGPLSWVGCALAALAIASLAAWMAGLSARLGAYDLYTLCQKTLGGIGGNLAALLYGAVVAVTAGAMVAAMGELCALALPIHHSYGVGILGATLLCAFLSRRGIGAIAAIGGWLLPASLILFFLIIRYGQPPETLPSLATPSPLKALPMALCYAAMNTALSCGSILEMGREMDKGMALRTFGLAGGMLLTLLFLANAALLPHGDALKGEALPIVVLSRPLGAVGYWLCILVLSLAVFTTLVALTRTLSNMLAPILPGTRAWLSAPLSLAIPLLLGLIGFDRIVGGFYPLMGVGSTFLFLAMMIKPRRMKQGI